MRLLILLFFVAAVLAISSSLIEAHAEDTYNFYFQKAPGPTVVNQGGAGPANSKDVVVNPVTTPATPTTVAQAAELEPESTTRSVELSFGVSGSSSTDKSNPYGYSNLLSGQYLLGLQVNMGKYVALQAEGFYLSGDRKNDWGDHEQLAGSRLDYSGALVITPFRLSPSNWLRISMSALGGWMTVPHSGYDAADGSWKPIIEHRQTLFYGARMGFELWNRVALQATVKRYEKFDSPNGTLALAFLL